jgi:hypothetical protein
MRTLTGVQSDSEEEASSQDADDTRRSPIPADQNVPSSAPAASQAVDAEEEDLFSDAVYFIAW